MHKLHGAGRRWKVPEKALDTIFADKCPPPVFRHNGVFCRVVGDFESDGGRWRQSRLQQLNEHCSCVVGPERLSCTSREQRDVGDGEYKKIPIAHQTLKLTQASRLKLVAT